MGVTQALYAAKICSYAQGMNLIRAKSMEKTWDLNLGELARIWKGGCIIRAKFLDRIKQVQSPPSASVFLMYCHRPAHALQVGRAGRGWCCPLMPTNLVHL